MNFLMQQEVPNLDLGNLDLYEEYTMYETSLSKFDTPNTYVKHLEEEEDSCCFYKKKTTPIQSSLQVPFNEFSFSPSFHDAAVSSSMTFSSPNSFATNRVPNTSRFSDSPVSSNYSISPLDSPNQPYNAEDFLSYINGNTTFMSRHQQGNDYPYAYNGFLSERRRKHDDQISYEESEKRRLRRERNKQAALRCRTRRRERIDALEQETAGIERDNFKVKNEIAKLEKQVSEMQKLLRDHKCEKHTVSNNSSFPQYSKMHIKDELV